MIFPPADAAAPPRTRVKICGLTHPDDAALAVALGADALGLNFHPGSPRCLDPARDGAWLRALPAGVRRVAVLVNPDRDGIRRLLGEGLVDAVQLHGDEDEAFCLSPWRKKASPSPRRSGCATPTACAEWSGSTPRTWCSTPSGPASTAARGTRWTGRSRRTSPRRERALGRRTILSGGLQPGNAAEAVRRVRPFGVDVASGVEGAAGPRRKDPARLREFLAAVHAADGPERVGLKLSRRPFNKSRETLVADAFPGKLCREIAFYREKSCEAGSLPALGGLVLIISLSQEFIIP